MADRMTGMAVFVKVVETGSFAAAARELGLSPQMVGRHIEAIERRLGTRLLYRSTRARSLTQAGRLYVDGCKRALAEADAADALVAAQVETPRGTLRVTAPVAFGTLGLMPAATRFLDAHAEVGLEIELTDRTVNLIDEGVDAAIRIGDLPDSGLIARQLAPYLLVPCASPAYLARAGAPTHPAELLHHQCLDYVFPSHPAPAVWLFTRDGRVVPVEPSSRLVVNDSRALIEAALQGFGIVLAAEVLLAEHLAVGRLVRVLPDYEGPTRPMQLVFPAHRAPAPKLRAFLNWMADAFAATGADGASELRAFRTP